MQTIDFIPKLQLSNLYSQPTTEDPKCQLCCHVVQDFPPSPFHRQPPPLLDCPKTHDAHQFMADPHVVLTTPVLYKVKKLQKCSSPHRPKPAMSPRPHDRIECGTPRFRKSLEPTFSEIINEVITPRHDISEPSAGTPIKDNQSYTATINFNICLAPSCSDDNKCIPSISVNNKLPPHSDNGSSPKEVFSHSPEWNDSMEDLGIEPRDRAVSFGTPPEYTQKVSPAIIDHSRRKKDEVGSGVECGEGREPKKVTSEVQRRFASMESSFDGFQKADSIVDSNAMFDEELTSRLKQMESHLKVSKQRNFMLVRALRERRKTTVKIRSRENSRLTKSLEKLSLSRFAQLESQVKHQRELIGSLEAAVVHLEEKCERIKSVEKEKMKLQELLTTTSRQAADAFSKNRSLLRRCEKVSEANCELARQLMAMREQRDLSRLRLQQFCDHI